MITEEAVNVWVQGVYGNSLNLPFNFAVNLKLLRKIFKGDLYIILTSILKTYNFIKIKLPTSCPLPKKDVYEIDGRGQEIEGVVE